VPGGLEYSLAYLELRYVLTVSQTEPEHRGMEVDPCLQIGNCDSDMIDREQDHLESGPSGFMGQECQTGCDSSEPSTVRGLAGEEDWKWDR
jgi:hypothetical protein